MPCMDLDKHFGLAWLAGSRCQLPCHLWTAVRIAWSDCHRSQIVMNPEEAQTMLVAPNPAARLSTALTEDVACLC
jgi:hypothetical protein